MAACTFFAAWQWVDRPFPGFVLNPMLNTDAVMMADWTGSWAGVHAFDQLREMNDRPVHAVGPVYAAVRAQPPGTRFKYVFQQEGQAPRTLVVPSALFGWRDFTAFFLSFWIAGVLYLSVGAWAMWVKPLDRAARANWTVCQLLGSYYLINFESTNAGAVYFLGTALLFALMPALIHLALVFPTPLLTEARHRLWVGVACIVALLCEVLEGACLLAGVAPGKVLNVGLVVPATVAIGVMGIWLWVAFARRFNPLARSRARIVLAGLAIGYLPLIICTILWPIWGHDLPYAPLFNTLLAIFPASVAYAIVQHQAFDIWLAWRRITLYVGVTLVLACLYGATLASATGLLSGRQGPVLSWVPTFLAAGVLALAFEPVYQRLRLLIDRRFIGQRADAMRTLATFAQHLPTDPQALEQELLRLVTEALAPGWIVLEVGPRRVYGSLMPPDEAALLSEDVLCVTLATDDPAWGRLFIGPRVTRIPYDSEERALVQVLANQVAVVLQNMLLQSEREAARVRESVAQALAEERRELVVRIVGRMRLELVQIDQTLASSPEDCSWDAVQDSLIALDNLLEAESRQLVEARVNEREQTP